MLHHLGTKTLETSRLILRQLTLSDAESLRECGCLERDGGGRETVAEWIRSYRDPQSYHWAVVLDGRAIGRIKGNGYSQRDHYIQLGYELGAPFRCRGLMTEALSAVLMFFLKEVGLPRVYCQARITNIASIRVMQKAGMQWEGRQRKHFLQPDGTYVDVDIYGLIREDVIGDHPQNG